MLLDCLYHSTSEGNLGHRENVELYFVHRNYERHNLKGTDLSPGELNCSKCFVSNKHFVLYL